MLWIFLRTIIFRIDDGNGIASKTKCFVQSASSIRTEVVSQHENTNKFFPAARFPPCSNAGDDFDHRHFDGPASARTFGAAAIVSAGSMHQPIFRGNRRGAAPPS